MTISVEITDAQADALPLMLLDNNQTETVSQAVQRIVSDSANQALKQKRIDDFNALSDADKEAAILAVKS